VDERIDPETEESLRRWALARAIWTLLILATFPASVFIWFLGGYSLCGTDTTEPAFGRGACDALVHPVVPWVAIAATPLVTLVLGGVIAHRRKDSRLFAFSLSAPLLLVIALVVFGAAD
jgi:hypothetical protein